MLDRVRSVKTWDVAVVGGGATGLGSALDAAIRGYRTILLEAFDFAKGTSSRSTKLVHGGVRYLARGEISLVREALHERGVMQRNAPHLVHDRAFLVPAYNWSTRPFYGIGLKMYDLLARSHRGLGSRIVGAREAIELVPTLEPKRLRGGVVYHDGQFDDARFAICLLRSLVDNTENGTALNYMPILGFLKSGERIVGVRASDAESGSEFEIRARVVINATGVFADSVRRLDEPSAQPMLSPSQGAHIVLDQSFVPGETAVLIPKTSDGRVLFAIPWHGRTLVGTTDTPVAKVAIEPKPLEEEIAFLLEQSGRYLSNRPTRADVKSAFAGLRPLVSETYKRSTAQLSREHHLSVGASGLVTITGGKWTTYRVMAADTVNRAAIVGGLEPRPCWTELHRLHGWQEPSANGSDIRSTYGSDAATIDRLAADDPGLARLLDPRLPYRAAEVVHAVRSEMARTVEDVLARRTRSLLLDARASRDVAGLVAEIMARELAKDKAWRDTQVQQFQDLTKQYLLD